MRSFQWLLRRRKQVRRVEGRVSVSVPLRRRARTPATVGSSIGLPVLYQSVMLTSLRSTLEERMHDEDLP